MAMLQGDTLNLHSLPWLHYNQTHSAGFAALLQQTVLYDWGTLSYLLCSGHHSNVA